MEYNLSGIWRSPVVPPPPVAEIVGVHLNRKTYF
jgi:hypothetical protein